MRTSIKHARTTWLGVTLKASLSFVLLFASFSPSILQAESVQLYGSRWNVVSTKPDIVTGSALDLSFLNNGPAGHLGFVKIDVNGNYYFEKAPENKVKFYGANLNWNMYYGSDSDIDKTVDRIAKMGYNVVRIHSQDTMAEWSGDGLFKKPRSSDIELNDVRLERFDYMLAKLKEKGIYISIDLFHLFDFDEIPGLGDYAEGQNSKYLLPLLPEAYSIWEQMTSLLLNHVNPYTGLALKDDPILVHISPWNEGLLPNLSFPANKPLLREYLLSDFNRYLRSKGASPIHAFPDSFWSVSGSLKSHLMQYYSDKTLDVYTRMKTYLKNQLGVKAVIGGLNYINSPYVNLWRDQVAEVFETHMFYQFTDTKVPSGIQYNPGRMRRLSEAFSITDWAEKWAGDSPFVMYYPSLALKQSYNKPLALTEFHDTFPGKGRDETSYFVGAIGAFQNWDMLNRFGLGISEQDGVNDIPLGGRGSFSIFGDPLAIISEYVGSLFFRTGYIRGSKPQFVIVRDRGYTESDERATSEEAHVSQLHYLPHLFNVATVYADKPGEPFALYKITDNLTRYQIARGEIPPSNKIELLPDMTLEEVARTCIMALEDSPTKQNMLDHLEKGELLSATGELLLNLNNNSFRVDTEKVAALAGAMNTQTYSYEKSGIKAEFTSPTGTFLAASLDNRALNQSNRVLLLYTTDTASETERYEPSGNGLMIYYPGTLPTIIREEEGVIRMRIDRAPERYNAYKLDFNGNRVSEIPLGHEDGELVMPIRTDIGFAFELTYTPINSLEKSEFSCSEIAIENKLQNVSCSR